MDGSFGALLRAHRRAAGLTQEALAERAALSGQAVGALERGDRRFPHRDTVARLVTALGLTVEQREAFVTAASRRAVPRPLTLQDHVAVTKAATPRQLPAALARFAGRASPVKTMFELLGRSSTAVAAISGMAGIGKTAFAVHWAHQVREQFPDGELYLNLRAFDPRCSPMRPETAICAFLEALDVPPHRLPASSQAQVGMYRSLVAGRRMLIVLDNAYDAEQVRPLLPGAPGCLVLVTSRNQLTSLAASDGADLITLDLLTVAEAHELLVARVGLDRVSAEPHAVEEIIARCARLPLALAIVAARATANPQFPLAALAKELCDAQGSLDVFHSGDAAVNVRAVFSWSYHALPDAAARLFRLLGIHPGPDIAAPAAASLADLPLRLMRPLLGELTAANLITEPIPGRYAFHDLLRAYAREQADAQASSDRHHAANHRLLDHYLYTAHAANQLLAPAGDPITLSAPHPGTTPERPADHREALDWFIAEHHVLLAAVDHAAAIGRDTHTWQLARSMTDFLNRRGHWRDDIAIQRVALAAAHRLADPAAQSSAHRLLAFDYTQLGSFDEAHTHLRRALDAAARAEDPIGQAHTHTQLAVVWDRQGHHDQALHHAEHALILFRANGHRAGQARALNAIGWDHALLGDHQQALAGCQQALTLLQELGDSSGEASTWDSLGYAHHHLGHYDQAVACYGRALALFRQLCDSRLEAEVLIHLGDTQHAAQRPGAARADWQRALDMLTELDHPDADTVQARLHRLGGST